MQPQNHGSSLKQIANRNCKVLSPNPEKPCNLKPAQNRKIDSRSAAYAFFTSDSLRSHPPTSISYCGELSYLREMMAFICFAPIPKPKPALWPTAGDEGGAAISAVEFLPWLSQHVGAFRAEVAFGPPL